MEISEFIDTYSDDLINIHHARAARFTHPLKGDYAFADFLDASFCRILAVFVVGGIEAMLESWRDRDRGNILEKYFAPNVKNGDRVKSLCQAFTVAGIQVDRQVFDDYLALKYLRNTIIHGRWKQHEQEWLKDRGFPTDTRKLKKEHLDRIEHVNQNMMLYIALTAVAEPNAPIPDKLVKLDETTTRRADESGILRYDDMNRIIWLNLERIDHHISREIEKVCSAEPYAPLALKQGDTAEIPWQDAKRLWYLAARQAGEENHPSLVQYRSVASDAISFWRDYWHHMAVKSPIDDGRIDETLGILQSPYFRVIGIADWCSLLDHMPSDEARRLVDSVLSSDAPFTSSQVISAMRTGRSVYHFIPNIVPVTLFTIRLPIVDPANTQEYLREANRALRALKVNREWYSWVENRCPPGDDGLEFYERMSGELFRRSSAK